MTNFCMVTCFLTMSSVLAGADSPPGKSYKLDFIVKDIEGGKTVNSHSYSMRAETGQPDSVGSIRTGSKVPTQNSSGNFSFWEVGVNIDVRKFREADGVVYLGVQAEVSSLVESSLEKKRSAGCPAESMEFDGFGKGG